MLAAAHLISGAALASAMLVAGCGSTSGDPPATCRQWKRLAIVDAEGGRSRHVAVRAGDGIYVWGGIKTDADGVTDWARAAWKLDPHSEQIVALPTAGEPTPRQWAAGVSSDDGRYVIVYGGETFDNEIDGARFDTVTQTWRALAGGTGGPPVEVGVAATVNGGFLYWGLDPDRNPAGAIYKFSEDVWVPVPVGGPLARTAAAAAEIPSEQAAIIWGGASAAVRGPAGPLGDGAALSFGNGSAAWKPIPVEADLSARARHSISTSDQTGEVVVWGGTDGDRQFDDGARRSGSDGDWIPIRSDDAPSARFNHYAVVLGERLVIFGGSHTRPDPPQGEYPVAHLADGGILNLSSNEWQALPACGPPAIYEGTFTKWSDTTAVLWGSTGELGAGQEQVWVFTLDAE